MARAGKGRRWWAVPGYAAFFMAAFVFFLWRELPYPEIARSLENRLRGRGAEISIRGLGPGAFPGMRAERVRVRMPGAGNTILEFTDVEVRPALGSLVRAHPEVEVKARAMGGPVRVRIHAGDRVEVRAEWSEWDLGRLPLPRDLAGLALGGSTEGHLEVADVRASPTRVEGRAEVRLWDLRIGPGKVRGFPVPGLTLGEGVLRLRASRGRVKIEEARIEGGDVGVVLSNATVALRQPFSRSLVNGLLTVSPNEKARRELALLFALFPGGAGSDGRYTARVRGTLGRLRLLRR